MVELAFEKCDSCICPEAFDQAAEGARGMFEQLVEIQQTTRVLFDMVGELRSIEEEILFTSAEEATSTVGAMAAGAQLSTEDIVAQANQSDCVESRYQGLCGRGLFIAESLLGLHKTVLADQAELQRRFPESPF